MNSVVYEDLMYIVKDNNDFISIKGKSILITGATGLICSMLTKSLLIANDYYDLGIEIYVLVRNKTKADNIFKDFANRMDFHILEDFEISKEFKCDYIVHGISITQSKCFIEQPIETLNTTINSTVRLLELARRCKAKLLYLSSMEMYGVPYEDNKIVTESDYGIIDPLAVRSSYSEGKRVAECYCTAYYHEYDVSIVVARLAQTFGAGVDISDNRVFMQFAKAVIRGENIVLHTTGKSMSNFCYLSDAIKAIILLLQKGKSGEAYNICNDKETRSYKEIADLVSKNVAGGRISVEVLLPKLNLGYAPDVKMYLSSKKLLNLGWNPKISMNEAYKKLVRYLKEEE